MRSFISGADIASEVQMQATAHGGAFLLVEGDCDRRLLSSFVDKMECLTIPAHCKANALEASTILARQRFDRALCIVDADFWHLDGLKPPLPGVLLTDSHDMETMVLSTVALDRVLAEFMPRSRYDKERRAIRARLLDGGVVIGCLRWLSEPTQASLGLTFRELQYDSFVDPITLRVNLRHLLREVAVLSTCKIPPVVTVEAKVDRMLKAKPDPWQVCCGHDLVNLLFIGLSRTYGGRRSKGLTLDALDSACRLSYDYHMFSQTRLYKAIRKWERGHKPHRILVPIPR